MEALIVASVTVTLSFLCIYLSDDCKPIVSNMKNSLQVKNLPEIVCQISVGLFWDQIQHKDKYVCFYSVAWHK